MRLLLADRGLALRLGEGARRFAMEHFNIGRFARDWDEALRLVTGARRSSPGMTRVRATEVGELV
jgi:hypothetical protein